MLGSLARKLRAFGFDTTYAKDADDSALISAAGRQTRILLTADVSLESRARARGVQAFLVSGKSDPERLRTMARLASEKGLSLSPARPTCSACNGRLRTLSRGEASHLVPGNVWARHRLFFECEACSKVYWRGGHWKKLRRLKGLLTSA